MNVTDLPSFRRSNFQRKAVSTDEINIVVEYAAKVHKIVQINSLNCIADLFLLKKTRLDIFPSELATFFLLKPNLLAALSAVSSDSMYRLGSNIG